MINESQARKFCKDYTLIENYEDAVNDPTQTWDCHHIFGEILTRQQLLDHDFYYDVPPCMLKFVTKAEHNRLHSKNHTEESRRKISEAMKGHIVTDETRRKISEAKKGENRSEESRRKISEARKGLTLSEETRRKISEAMKGKKHTEATRRKMSETRKGRPSPRKGVTLSEEHRRKLSEAAKRRWAANK